MKNTRGIAILVTIFCMFIGFQSGLCICDCGIKAYDYFIQNGTRNITQCDAYTSCWDREISSHHFCTEGLEFNIHTLSCDYPENVECPRRQFNKQSNSLKPSANKAKPSELTDPSNCPKQCGIFPNPLWNSNGQLICSSYLYCAGGDARVYYCSDGLLFNQETGTCDYASNVNCNGTTASTTTSTVSPTSRPTTPHYGSSTFNPRCPNGDGQYVDPNNVCTDFYISCEGGKRYTRYCPLLYYFNPVTLQCEESYIVCQGMCGCYRADDYCAPGPTFIPPKHKECLPFTCPEEDGVFPNPQDCQKYYSCSSGDHITMMCPSDTLFDVVTKQCITASRSTCAVGC